MEQQLKQRLTGAIVIVSLAVIFIPVILEGPRDEWTPRDHTIPEPPELDYTAPPELPLPAAPAAPPVADAGDTPIAAPPAVVPPPPPPPEPEPAPPAPEPPPASAPAAATLASGWYVQIGSFSQQANVKPCVVAAHVVQVTSECSSRRR